MRRACWVWLVAVWLLVGPAGPAAAGGWTWPLGDASAVGRSFDPPAHRYGAGHRGVDLAAAAGTPVVAAGAGRVSYAGLLAGRGVVVVVHGDLRTTYEPVDAAVAVGQVVAAGEVLGTLAGGHAGCAADACLHWGLRRGEEYLDPLTLVGGGPVRLLPLEPVGALEPGPAPAAVGAPAPVGDAEVATPADRPRGDGPSLDARLRSAASPSGAVALAALVAGIALLRPGRPPRRPGGAGAGAAEVADPSGAPGAVSTAEADVVDLGAERYRRRAAG